MSDASVDTTDPAGDRATPRRRRWRRLGLIAAATLFALVLVAEIATRVTLGSAAISVPHPTIEYLFAPNQSVTRFGSDQRYNRWHMRSDDFAAEKTDPLELRILVIGDSVVNGGNFVDQAELATEIVRDRLGQRTRRPVVVANIAAGSWGPANQLAYLREFGLFDADAVVFVWNTKDVIDRPTFAPLNSSTQPTRRPISAALDAFNRYALPMARYHYARWTADEPETLYESLTPGMRRDTANPTPEEIDAGAVEMRDAIDFVWDQGVPVAVVHHAHLKELLDNDTTAMGEALRSTAKRAGAAYVSNRDHLLAASERGEQIYRDPMHPTASGQAALADAAIDVLEKTIPQKLETIRGERAK